jgi:hypothetical protein
MWETIQSSHRLCPVMALVRAFLTPTASGDGAGAHFCVPLPSSPHFSTTCPDSQGTRKSRWSRVGSSKIILDFYPVICLVRWIMDRLGKVGREVVKKLDYQW